MGIWLMKVRGRFARRQTLILSCTEGKGLLLYALADGKMGRKKLMTRQTIPMPLADWNKVVNAASRDSMLPVPWMREMIKRAVSERATARGRVSGNGIFGGEVSASSAERPRASTRRAATPAGESTPPPSDSDTEPGA